MRVKIVDRETNAEVNATIKEVSAPTMPGIQEGWEFNFNRHVVRQNCYGYILVTDDMPTMPEGAMILELKDNEQPIVTFLEVAPHNRTPEKKYDKVAGCLIAYAFKQTYILAKGDFQGLLSIYISEEDPANKDRLVKNYATKYNAQLNTLEYFNANEAMMVIIDEDGDALIEKYLTYK